MLFHQTASLQASLRVHAQLQRVAVVLPKVDPGICAFDPLSRTSQIIG